MAYEKNTWQTGDTITATKLNNMENGIANAGMMIVNVTVDVTEEETTYTADKTYTEIGEAIDAGRFVVVKMGLGYCYLYYDSREDDGTVGFYGLGAQPSSALIFNSQGGITLEDL